MLIQSIYGQSQGIGYSIKKELEYFGQCNLLCYIINSNYSFMLIETKSLYHINEIFSMLFKSLCPVLSENADNKTQ